MFVRRAIVASRIFAVNKTGLLVASTRFFSSIEQVNRAGAKLAKALEKEIKYETDNYTQIEDIENFLKDSGFNFTEEERGIKMVLSRQIGDKKVEILFEARYS